MRVVAGTLRGRRLSAPRGGGTRPTADRVREALFSIVGPVEGLCVLDLFAGSGALGIEALSRGAARAVLVDRSRAAAECAGRNVRALGLDARARVVARDWRAALAAERAAGRRFGLCLIDPPYSLTGRIVDGLGAALGPVLDPDATVVIERAATLAPPEPTGLEVASRTDRTYGDTAVTVMRVAGAGGR